MTWWDDTTRQHDNFQDDDSDDVTINDKWSDVRVDKIDDVTKPETGQTSQTGFKPIRYWVNDVADNLDPSSAEIPREKDFPAQKLATEMGQNKVKKAETKKDFGLAGFLRV